MLYNLQEAMMILVKLMPYLSTDFADNLMALYCHASFGNFDGSSGVEDAIRHGVSRMGILHVREQVFQKWRRIYRRADVSEQLFIPAIQREEKRVFGYNQLYEMKRAGIR